MNPVWEQKVSKCLSTSSVMDDSSTIKTILTLAYNKNTFKQVLKFSAVGIYMALFLQSTKDYINYLNLKLCWKWLFHVLPGWLMDFLLYSRAPEEHYCAVSCLNRTVIRILVNCVIYVEMAWCVGGEWMAWQGHFHLHFHFLVQFT